MKQTKIMKRMKKSPLNLNRLTSSRRDFFMPKKRRDKKNGSKM
jgi:hypothetical protein